MEPRVGQGRLVELQAVHLLENREDTFCDFDVGQPPVAVGQEGTAGADATVAVRLEAADKTPLRLVGEPVVDVLREQAGSVQQTPVEVPLRNAEIGGHLAASV